MPTLEENVNRVKAAKTAIGNAITAKGGTVGANDGLEDFAADITTIPSGGENIYYPVDLSIGATKDIPNNIIICRRNGRFMIIGSYIASVSATDLILKYPDDLEVGTLTTPTGFSNIFYSSSRTQERPLNTKSIDTQAKTITLTPIQVLAANTNWTLDIEFNETFT